MNRKKLLKLAMVQGIIALAILLFNYLFYHFVTDTGITLVFQPEPGKPFVALLIGILGTLFVFSALTSLVAAFVLYEGETVEEEEIQIEKGEEYGKLQERIY